MGFRLSGTVLLLSRLREIAGTLLGVPHRPRTGASAGADPHQPFHRIDGSMHAIITTVPGCAEQVAVGAWGVGVIGGIRQH